MAGIVKDDVVVFQARWLDFAQETARAALIVRAVVQAAFWTRQALAALDLSTLWFPAADVPAVFSYCCILFVLGGRPGCGCSFWSGQAECMPYNLARD
jgi:hypothetical protein